MTVVAFQQALRSRWIVNIILAAALLSCSNASTELVAASRLFFAMGRRGMIAAGVPVQSTSDIRLLRSAVFCVGIATAICMLLGDAILVPVTEVGSVACAIGWAATCAAYLALEAVDSDDLAVQNTVSQALDCSWPSRWL